MLTRGYVLVIVEGDTFTDRNLIFLQHKKEYDKTVEEKKQTDQN